MPSKVSIVKCSDYAPQKVSAAVKETFRLLDLSGIIKPGLRVLLKPNLLMAFDPSKGTTTHPSIMKAIAKEVCALGANPFLGDSPGGVGAMYAGVLKATGMQDLGIPIAYFEEKGMRKFENPKGCVDPIYISNVALSFDLVINVPKLKTHELTQMTCAIKNMFGCVPGLQKVTYHLDAPTPEKFSGALVDLFQRIIPAVTIVDAVVVMEGHGPSGGELRDAGLVIASRDAVAVDAVCSKIIGYDPLDIHTTRIAAARGLGEADLEKIEIAGEPIKEIKDFKHPAASSSIINRIPAPLIRLLKPVINLIKIRPVINRRKCVKCMMCVRACPAKAIDKNSFKINKNLCIMCFCCRELCKYGAVDLQESMLWKTVNKLRKSRK